MEKTLTDWETVKKDLKLADNEMDSHETDLYVINTKETREYFVKKNYSFTGFRSEIDGKS